MYLSFDTRVLIGIVAADNLGFHKSVIARFTLDHWKTVSEVVAKFDPDVLTEQTKDSCDRFVFKIKLEDQTHLEDKTMSICIRYNVNNREYWDNNNSVNHQVNFSKRFESKDDKPYMETRKGHVANVFALQRPPLVSTSKARSITHSHQFVPPDWFPLSPRPTVVPGNSIVGLKDGFRIAVILPDTPNRSRDPDDQQLLSNHYDLDNSLAVAVQASEPVVGDGKRVPSGKDVTSVSKKRLAIQTGKCKRPQMTRNGLPVDGGIPSQSSSQLPIPHSPESTAGPIVASSPLGSSSYTELLDEFCFVSIEPWKGVGNPLQRPPS